MRNLFLAVEIKKVAARFIHSRVGSVLIDNFCKTFKHKVMVKFLELWVQILICTPKSEDERCFSTKIKVTKLFF